MIEIGELRLESPFSIQEILDISVEEKVNEHPLLKIKGILTSESENELYSIYDGTSITLISVSEENPLFCGFIENAIFSVQNGYTEVTLLVYGHSRKLDVKEKSRTFQNSQLTYRKMMQSIYKENNGAILFNKESTINAPIIQYLETEWEYTLRMASHFKTIVISKASSTKAQVCVGIPSGSTVTVEEPIYEEGYHHKKWTKDQTLYSESVSMQHYYYAKFDSYTNYALGSTIVLNEKSYLIVEKKAILDKGYIHFFYTLGSEVGYGISYYEIGRLIGLTLFGEVIDRQGENVKVHFDIDEKQSKEDAFWFSYKPEVDDVFYTMPIIGTRVGVKFLSGFGGSGIAIHCQRTNGETCSDLIDYNKRYYTTEFGKQMGFLPDSLYFTGGDTTVLLDDAKGSIYSTKQLLQLSSAGKIQIHAKKRILLNTPEQIKAGKTGLTSGIDLSANELNIYSEDTQFHSDGTNELSYPSFDTTPAVTLPTTLTLKITGSQIGKINGR